MTRRANASVAGAMFLVYFALGIPALILMNRATHATGIAAQLARIAEHASDVRLAALLNLYSGFCALALGVALWALTRDQDRDLAMLGLAFRIGEGLAGGMSIQRSLALLWIATTAGAEGLPPESAHALGAYLLRGQGGAAFFFAVGSTIFSWLLLRGRMIPTALAWLGFVASAVLVVVQSVQLLGLLPGSFIWFIWIPLAAYEIPLALWLIFKGAAPPAVERAREAARLV